MEEGCVSNAAKVLHPRLRVVGAVTLTGIMGPFIRSGLGEDLSPIEYNRMGSLQGRFFTRSDITSTRARWRGQKIRLTSLSFQRF